MATQPSDGGSSTKAHRSGFRLLNKTLGKTRTRQTDDTPNDKVTDDDWSAAVDDGRGDFQESNAKSGEGWAGDRVSEPQAESHGAYREFGSEESYQGRNFNGEEPWAESSNRNRGGGFGMPPQQPQHPLPPPPPPTSNWRGDPRPNQGVGQCGKSHGRGNRGQYPQQQGSRGSYNGPQGNWGPPRDGHAMQGGDVYAARHVNSSHHQLRRDDQHQFASQTPPPPQPQVWETRHQQQQHSYAMQGPADQMVAVHRPEQTDTSLQNLQEVCRALDIDSAVYCFRELAQTETLQAATFNIAAEEINQLLRNVGQDSRLTCEQLGDLAYNFGSLHRFKEGSCLREVMQLLSELTWRRTEQLAPSSCSNFIWGFACMSMREDRLMSVMAAGAVKMIRSFDHRHLANAAWGFSKAGLWNQDLANCLALECKQKIESFSPESLSNVTWAMAQWSYKEDELLDKIAVEVQNRCEEFQPGSLAMAAWAFSNLMLKNEGLMSTIADYARNKMPMFKKEDLAHLAWAFANLKIQDRTLFGLMANEVMHGAKGLGAPELANIAWAFSKSNFASPNIMKTLADEAAVKIGSFKSSELTMMTWAYAAVSQQHPAMMSQIGDMVVRHAERFTDVQLAHVTWAFGALAMRHAGLIEFVAESSQARPDRFKGHGLVHIAWTFAKVSYWSTDFFHTVAPIIIKEVSHMKPLTLCRCAWAYSSFALDNTVIEAVMDASCEKLHEFTTKDLIKLVDRSPTTSKMMSAYQCLQKGMHEKCDEIAKVLANVYLQGPDALGYAESCERLRQLFVGITDFGLTATPRILSKLNFEMPSFDAMMHARRLLAQHNIFQRLKSSNPARSESQQQSRQCFITAEVDVEVQTWSQQESFTIDWSENWFSILQDHMEGTQDRNAVIYNSLNVAIDPFTTQPDRSTFPLRLTRFTVSRQPVQDSIALCFETSDVDSSGRPELFCTACENNNRGPRQVEEAAVWSLFGSHKEEPATHALHLLLAEVCTLLGVGRDFDKPPEATQGRIAFTMSTLPALGSIIMLLQLRSYLPKVKVEFIEMQTLPYDG